MSVLLLVVGIALLAWLWRPRMIEREWLVLMVGMCLGAFAYYVGAHWMAA